MDPSGRAALECGAVAGLFRGAVESSSSSNARRLERAGSYINKISDKLLAMRRQAEKDDMEAVQCDEKTVRNEKLVQRLQIREEEYLNEQRKLNKTYQDASQQLSKFVELLRKVREEYAAQQRQAEHAAKEWRESVDRYEKLLGVKIGGQDGRVEFTFVGISSKYASQPFTIDFAVDKDTGAARGIYSNPPVPKMAELLRLYEKHHLPIPVVLCLARRLFEQHFGETSA